MMGWLRGKIPGFRRRFEFYAAAPKVYEGLKEDGLSALIFYVF
jgi:hypothetical protein